VVASRPTLLAHAADARLRALLESRLPELPEGAGETTILLATQTLADNADEALIGKALDAWSDGELLVVSVDGATPPLGLRDVERIAWTPGKDDDRLAAIVARLALPGAAPSAPAAPAPQMHASPSAGAAASASIPSPSAAGSKRQPPRGLAIAAVIVVGMGLLSVFVTVEHERSAAPPPQVSAPAPAPTGSPVAPAPLPTASPPETGRSPAPVRAPSPAPLPPSKPAPLPDLGRPSGGGAPAPRPVEPEPAAGLSEWVVIAFWLVPAFLVLALIHYLTRRRRGPAEPVAAAKQAPDMPARAPAMATQAGDGGQRIFVSYSHQDIARVDPIIAEIEKLGHAVWIDRRELSGGPGWAGQIVRGLRAARSVVLMASRHAYASDQVVREMYLAMSEKKPIVPLELEAAEIPDELQYILAPFQRHRLDGGDRSSVVRNALAAL
jgi:hypothetical protein